jgi:hypothetical protein
MSFGLYELAVNPDVQDKLVVEIRENEIKNGGKFDYNSIQSMVYMDMFISGKSSLFTITMDSEQHIQLHTFDFVTLLFKGYKR